MTGVSSKVERRVAGIVRTIGFDTGGEQSPLYIAPTPGTSGLTEPQLPVPRNDLNTKSYPRDESHITVDKLEENLRFALELCKNIEKDEEVSERCSDFGVLCVLLDKTFSLVLSKCEECKDAIKDDLRMRFYQLKVKWHGVGLSCTPKF